MLAGAGKLTFGLAAGVPTVQTVAGSQSSENASAGRLKFIVCCGHPGDPEYGCGGTIARLTARGHDAALSPPRA
jgi:hypothetical protein